MDKSELHPEICRVVESSTNYSRKEVVQALDRYASMRPIFDKIAADYCAIIAPSAVDEVPLGLSDMGSAAFDLF